MDRLDLIPPTILACCVLHNICLQENADNADIYDSIWEETQAVDDEEPEPDIENNDRDENEGRAKRDYIAASLQ